MMLARVPLLIAMGVGCGLSTTPAYADDASEIVRIHVAAIGGRDRIAALYAYRATGRIVLDGQPVGLTVIAARPSRLRVEMQYADRQVIQATDGRGPPWEKETAAGASRTAPMNANAAKDFMAEAEFDDPLVGAEFYGNVIDFAGRMDSGGRSLIRLLVTHRLQRTFYLLLDSATYLIVQRIDDAPPGAGATVGMVTQYGDYRPVAGVLVPHAVTVQVEGQPAREAILENIEANPALPPECFTLKPDSLPKETK